MDKPRRWPLFLLLALLVPSVLQAQKSPDVRAGVLTVLWGDPLPGSNQAALLLGLLTEDDGKTTEIELTEELFAAVGGLNRLSNRRVEVSLKEVGFAPFGPRQVIEIQLIGPTEPAAVSGSQPWVSILCKFSDIATEPKNLNYFLGMYANGVGGLDHYWRQLSSNQINIAGSTAAGWFTLPQPRSYYITSTNTNLTALFNDCTAAANPSVDFSNGGSVGYSGINMMFNESLGCCAWGGGHSATLDGINKAWRVTWEPPWGYATESVIAHEMGHGFGLPHSNNSDGDGSPYDSPWDVLSDPYGYALNDAVYGTLGKHTISYHKDLLGWIPPSERFEVLKNGTYNLIVDDLALATTPNRRIAKIRVPGSSRSYTVEARKHTGYDAALAGEAVIVHEVDPWRSEPAWLVDADTPPASYSDNEGVMWRPGETFADPTGQFQMQVNGAVGSGFDITLTSNRSGAIYQEGFDAGAGGFFADGLWHRSSACEASSPGHTSPTAFFFGIDSQCNYDDGEAPFGWLASPLISLSGLAPPLALTFRYFLATETARPGADLVLVYISPTVGAFQIVASNNSASYGGVPLEDPTNEWKTLTVDLEPLAGSDFYVYFYFQASDSAANQYAGFYVDDIKLWSCFSEQDLNLNSQAVSTQKVFRACNSVTACQSFQVAAGGDVTFRAGKSITLKSGFSVDTGATFQAVIGAPEQ